MLEHAGLVSRCNGGKAVLCRVEASRLDEATLAMTDLAARWDRRRASIKRLAEAVSTQVEEDRGADEVGTGVS